MPKRETMTTLRAPRLDKANLLVGNIKHNTIRGQKDRVTRDPRVHSQVFAHNGKHTVPIVVLAIRDRVTKRDRLGTKLEP